MQIIRINHKNCTRIMPTIQQENFADGALQSLSNKLTRLANGCSNIVQFFIRTKMTLQGKLVRNYFSAN